MESLTYGFGTKLAGAPVTGLETLDATTTTCRIFVAGLYCRDRCIFPYSCFLTTADLLVVLNALTKLGATL